MIEFLNIIMIFYYYQNIIKIDFFIMHNEIFTIKSEINYIMEIIVI